MANAGHESDENGVVLSKEKAISLSDCIVQSLIKVGRSEHEAKWIASKVESYVNLIPEMKLEFPAGMAESDRNAILDQLRPQAFAMGRVFVAQTIVLLEQIWLAHASRIRTEGNEAERPDTFQTDSELAPFRSARVH